MSKASQAVENVYLIPTLKESFEMIREHRNVLPLQVLREVQKGVTSAFWYFIRFFHREVTFTEVNSRRRYSNEQDQQNARHFGPHGHPVRACLGSHKNSHA